IDEVPKFVGRPIQVARCKEIDSVVAPAELPIELVQRHNLDRRDAYRRQRGQLPRSSRKSPLASESANMHFVEDLLRQRNTAPARIMPDIVVRIDDYGRTMGSFGLPTRRWIGKRGRAIEPISVASAGRCG